MNNRSILFSYLKDRVGIIISFLCVFGIMSLLFFLYDYALTAVLYSFLLSAVFMLTIAIRDFHLYRKRCLSFQRLKDNTEALSNLIPSGSLPEKELIQTINQLYSDLRENEKSFIRRQSETDAYYSMWVHQIKVPISAMHLTLQNSRSEETPLLRQELFKIDQYADMALGYLRIDSISSDLRLTTIDMRELLSSMIKKFASGFIYRKLSVKLHAFKNRVLSDEKWLRFITEQLLSNALKYTKQGGIEIYMDKYDRLYIKDSGIGIAAEDLPRIFERGFTGSNGRIDMRATGLGLFLADKTARQLNHRLEITSELGVGTTCILHLHRERLQNSVD